MSTLRTLRVRLITFSVLCSTLSFLPDLRRGANALLSNDRVDSFRFDDENFWWMASEYRRGNIGLVDYLLWPINGNLFVLSRALFLVWPSQDWIEMRFVLGVIPGAIALSCSTYFLMRLISEVGCSIQITLGLGLIFALAPHSKDLYNGLAMNGLALFVLPVALWLLLKQQTRSEISLLTILLLSLVPLLIDGRNLILLLVILMSLELLLPSSFRSRFRFVLLAMSVSTSTFLMTNIAKRVGSPRASFSQPDYPEYPELSLLSGIWVGAKSHVIHMYWALIGSDEFIRLGGTDPMPQQGAALALLVLVTTLLCIYALARQRSKSSLFLDGRLRLVGFCVMAIGGYVLAISLGRGESGWDWNAPRYSSLSPILSVLYVAVASQISLRRSWRVLVQSWVCLLLASYLTRTWAASSDSSLVTKTLDMIAQFALVGLVAGVFLANVSAVVNYLENDTSRVGATN